MPDRNWQFVCTPENPWTPEKARFAMHPQADLIIEQQSGWPAGDYETYKCPVCGHIFEVELPQ